MSSTTKLFISLIHCVLNGFFLLSFNSIFSSIFHTQTQLFTSFLFIFLLLFFSILLSLSFNIHLFHRSVQLLFCGIKDVIGVWLWSFLDICLMCVMQSFLRFVTTFFVNVKREFFLLQLFPIECNAFAFHVLWFYVGIFCWVKNRITTILKFSHASCICQ